MMDFMNLIGAWINTHLSAPIAAFFHPTNVALGAIDSPMVWKICAVGLFFAAMAWVFFLKKEYVNMSAPRKNIFFDLRFWTVLSMLPHVLIYFWLGT